MLDRIRIRVKAGDGGSGCNSFKGVKFSRGRHPDGGGGGRGADVIFRVDSNIQNLEDFRFKHYFRAESGKDGQANRKQGAQGRPCFIRVPPGTIVRDRKNNLLLRDLIKPDEELVVAKGGRGGRGNSRTKAASSGQAGEERELALEFRLVADIGIVGCPNSGKSTLLGRISEARPKIDHYPFTTVSPVRGVVTFPDFSEPAVLTVVELPGLIAGSTQGKGLGAQFLGHVQRVKALIHLIDMATEDAAGPLANLQSLNQELRAYSSELAAKPQILVANKMDLPGAERNLKIFAAQIKGKIYPLSALRGWGIEALLADVRNYFAQSASQ